MRRFFKFEPMEGKPIAMKGIAEGLRRLSKAFEDMRISCGHIEWSKGYIPTIVIDPLLFNSGLPPHVWQIKYIDGVLAMYMPANAFRVNDKDFTALQTGISEISGSDDWYDIDAFKTTGLNAYVNYEDNPVYNYSGQPISLALGTDASVSPSGKYLTFPIIAYDATQGLYALHHSAINYERTGFDGDKTDSLFNSLSRAKDNGFWDDEDHTIGLNGFMTAVELDEDPFIETTPERTQHIAVRETNSTDDGADLRWYDLRTLISTIKTAAETAAIDYVTLNISDVYDDTWFDWYDSEVQTRKFWEVGASETINNGSGIGNLDATKIIDLTNQTLIGAPDEEEEETTWNFGLLYGRELEANIAITTPKIYLVSTSSGGVYVDDTKVIGAQGAAVADATGAGDVVAQLNTLLARLRTHGLIAT